MEQSLTDEMIKKLILWVENSHNLVKEQLPEYIEQYLMAKSINYWIEIVFLCVFTAVFAYLSFYAIKKSLMTENSSDLNFFIIMASVLGPLGATMCFTGIYQPLQKLVEIYFSPKVVILRHLKDMLTP